MIIYSASVDEVLSGHDVSYYYPVVSDYRRRKIDGLIFEKDKKLCVSAELLLIRAMREAGVYEEGYRIVAGTFGKPELLFHPEFCFNLSHSGTMVLCAAASDPVGCDIERISPCLPEFAKRYFTRGEFERLMSCSAGFERDLFFCRLWTIKESFMKAVGLGMSISPNSFEIEFLSEGTVDIHQDISRAEFEFIEGDCSDGYCRSVCIQS